MNIHLISPFDKIAKVVLNESILSRAEKKNIVRYNFYNLFEYADPPQRKIDDAPYGGGYGMILKPEPVFRVVDTIKKNNLKNSSFRIIFPTPDGVKLNQKISEEATRVANESQQLARDLSQEEQRLSRELSEEEKAAAETAKKKAEAKSEEEKKQEAKMRPLLDRLDNIGWTITKFADELSLHPNYVRWYVYDILLHTHL